MRGKSVQGLGFVVSLPYASMRPAHYAREVELWELVVQPPQRRFNEARALCAGSPKPPGRGRTQSHSLQ